MKANTADIELSGSSDRPSEAETVPDTTETSDCCTSTSAATTTKTTFDELMKALNELEADDTLPSASRRGPSWRECGPFYFENNH